MDTVEYGHFLLEAINNAEDISLFLGTYNACLTDDILRGSATLDDRPLVVFGSDKRHAMCRKKLPVIYEKSGIDYNESLVTFVTADTLQEFVTQALGELKSGETVEADLEDVTVGSSLEVVKETVEEIHLEPEVVEIVKPKLAKNTESEVVEKPQIIETSTEQQDNSLCSFGVPKLKVVYQPPNVLGLQESLFVNLEQEEISKFFASVKSRVLVSIDNDN